MAIGRGRYYLNDPASGHRVVDQDTFDRYFTGVALSFRPSDAFEPGGEPPSVLRRLWPWLREYRAALAFAAACGLLLALPMLALPLLLLVFVDHVLIDGQPGWGSTLVGAVASAGILVYLLTWLQMRSLRKLVIRLSTNQSDHYISRLFRLPIQFFAHRYAGDLASRVQLINQVAKVGAGQLVGLAIEILMSLLFLALMFAYDVPLALVVLALAGFQRNRPPLIKNFNLTIEPGQRVAVIGPSGSGKSTLALLAAGVYVPWSGEILFDGHPRTEIPREVLSDSVSIVDQHATLFAATVRDNLTMWNSQTPDEHLTAAARDAAIHDEIIARPLGYDAEVEEGGRNFSGGQRQRLEVARGLVNNPTLLILDEATSALDTLTELRVDNGIRRRNCSCLIVAHRLSTIRDSDRILVLNRGQVVEQGTHEALIADEGGFYRRFLHGQ